MVSAIVVVVGASVVVVVGAVVVVIVVVVELLVVVEVVVVVVDVVVGVVDVVFGCKSKEQPFGSMSHEYGVKCDNDAFINGVIKVCPNSFGCNPS